MIKKYIDVAPVPHYIANINGACTNEEKAIQLQQMFFPPPPLTVIDDIYANGRAMYPHSVYCPQIVTMRQLQNVINKLHPNKAPGPDEIPNRVLKKTFKTTKHHLLAMANSSVKLSHFPTAFKNTSTIVLRKPGKPDYTKPNAYRPIALENILGKVLESIMAEILSYLTETHKLIPPQHFGGRPGRTSEDAMIILTEKIHHTRKERDIYSIIFMDVGGIFNNVHHERLFDNLHKQRVPEFMVKWIQSFLSNRSTNIRFNGVTSQTMRTDAGVPQGSPMSPILYMFYNADLLDIPKKNNAPGAQSLGFIDDIAYGVQGQSTEENVQIL